MRSCHLRTVLNYVACKSRSRYADLKASADAKQTHDRCFRKYRRLRRRYRRSRYPCALGCLDPSERELDKILCSETSAEQVVAHDL